MTTQQQSIQYALEQLRRPAWPEAATDFGSAPLTLPSSPDSELVAAVCANPPVESDRWTCRVTSAGIKPYLAASNSAPIVIHAIDADLAVPLLAHWAVRHREVLLWLVELLRKRTSASVRLILPNDLPGTWRREFKRTPAEWIEPKYPAGHWRMLPHVLGLQKMRPLVLDSIAAVDLARQFIGQPSTHLPIAIVDVDRTDPREFRLVERGTLLNRVLPPDESVRWFEGPRWRRREASPGRLLDGGELVFFADREARARQSPCVRCGWCEYICPTRCSPVEFLRAQRDHDLVRAHRSGLDSCIDCGLCTNVCPSNLPLHLFIDRLRSAQKTETS